MTPPARLVLPDSPLASTVRALEAKWRREFGGQEMAWDEAWLWGAADGYATFEHAVRLPLPGTRFWILNRVWIRPQLRRQGLLSALWPTLEERYGRFEVAAAGAEMTAFLAKRARAVHPRCSPGA